VQRFNLFSSKKIQLISSLLLLLAAGGSLVFASGAMMAPKQITTNATNATTVQASVSKPAWKALSAEQKLALAPLMSEWDRLDELRKKKWLEIANKYPSMKADEQARVHERMKLWMKLSPEQRMQARENFVRSTQIAPEQKSAQWQQYQQLSEEKKKQLAEEASGKKRITNIPPESQRNVKSLAPIRIGPAAEKKSPSKLQEIPVIIPNKAEQANVATTPAPELTNTPSTPTASPPAAGEVGSQTPAR
jgi:hypothetical protein